MISKKNLPSRICSLAAKTGLPGNWFFSQVRGAKGFQNNPSALDATYSIKKLVIGDTSGEIEHGNTGDDDGAVL